MKSQSERAVFLTFGGGKTWSDAARRLSAQAKETGLFEKIIIETSDTFFKKNGEFLRHRPFIENHPRGWGYWIWKPFLTLKHLKRLNDGEILVYLDAGCEILSDNKDKFRLMLDQCASTGNLFFDYAAFPILNAPFWTKQSLMDRFRAEFGLTEFLRIPTVWAGGFGLVKNEKNLSFLEDWLRYCVINDYHFVDDSVAPEPLTYSFFEHRHDQAIMSLLAHYYVYPSYCSAAQIDFVQIGSDWAEHAYAQPFLAYRNPKGVSALEEARFGPAGETFATHLLALNLQYEHAQMLKDLGLIDASASQQVRR